MLKVKNPKHKH